MSPKSLKFSSILALAILASATLALSACVKKATIKPRSEVIQEAQEQGIPIPSIEEEREVFFGAERKQRERLLALIRDRSSGSIRDVNYRIGAGDELEINVFDVPELNVTSRVRASGFLSLPLIGAVSALGMTESELHEELTKRLSSFVKNPQVNIFISQFGSQKVAVMGAVRTPGAYPLKKGTNSILELLSEAGGVSDKAGNFLTLIPSEVSGVSGDNDVDARARLALAASDGLDNRQGGIDVYLDQILGTSGAIPLEIPVRGGDMIIVPEAGHVMVEGEVEKAGAYELGQQTTLLGTLAAAGGIAYSAKVDEVEIVRELGIERKGRLVIDLTKIANGEENDIRLRNGDVVRVPSDPGRRMTFETFSALSHVINFGIGGTVNLAHP